ncbi:hypothetical protein [Paracoccus simplex]|uniref:Secreted protein n=1 Tax=Paracoccus simplex TaxID=2086346 RepID=A0ABV7RVM4_9RHOB
MNNRQLAFFCGLAAGFVLKGFCDLAMTPRGEPAGPPRVRTAGRHEMEDPPRDWDMVDEQGDESFPASDPPGNY